MTPQPASSAQVRSAARDGGTRGGLLFYGLLVPPLVWAVELYLNFGLASHACFPSEAPRASFLPGWERIWIALLVVNIVCAAICAIGLLASGYSWRRLRVPHVVATEEIGGAHDPSEERMRSFAVSGLMVSGLFTLAILFNTVSLWALSTCSQV
jgi:hypothetical protein